MSDAEIQPTMTSDELRETQRKLGLSDAELAFVLGIRGSQQIRRLKSSPDAAHFREIQPWHVRLLLAYLSGYRPPDWPWSRKSIAKLTKPKIIDEPPPDHELGSDDDE